MEIINQLGGDISRRPTVHVFMIKGRRLVAGPGPLYTNGRPVDGLCAPRAAKTK